MSETVSLLSAARGRAGLSQRALAARSGIPQASVSRIESGLISPRMSTVDRWLEACGMKLQLLPAAGAGIDRSAIRERLALTPTERSRLGQQEADAMLDLARGRLLRRQRTG